MAQGHNYSYNKIELGSKFRRNLISCGITLNLDLDGCARWHEVTITTKVKWIRGLIFKGSQRVGESNWVGAWMAARGGARLQLQLQ